MPVGSTALKGPWPEGPALFRVRRAGSGIDQCGGLAVRWRGCGSVPRRSCMPTAPICAISLTPDIRSPRGVRVSASGLVLPAAQSGRVNRPRGQHDRHRNPQQKFAYDLDCRTRGYAQKLCQRRPVLRTNCPRDWCFPQCRYRQDQPSRVVAWQKPGRAANTGGRANAATSDLHPKAGA